MTRRRAAGLRRARRHADDFVAKVVADRGQPVAKISDEPGKTMSRDEGYVRYLKHVFSPPSC